MSGSIWLFLLYKLPADSSSLRVYVWRRLRNLGGFYLQNSVCVLPDREDLRDALERLREEVENRQGSAMLIRIRLVDEAEEARMTEHFRNQSDEEYREFLGKCRDLHVELQHEREIRNLTFAELEENEMELGKIRAWLPKIRARDFFGAGRAHEAAHALAGCEEDLERFGNEVAEAQGPVGGEKPKDRPKPGRKPKPSAKDDGSKPRKRPRRSGGGS